ncbi:hypothetical protein BN439_1568 [Erwinia amylovora Ea644]|nr:hypothetical protein BN439_1568 [Erwinia amylovora Ea644]CCP06653.1 hypothetical protein BN440_1621 [Erwinia amylovora MR1]
MSLKFAMLNACYSRANLACRPASQTKLPAHSVSGLPGFTKFPPPEDYNFAEIPGCPLTEFIRHASVFFVLRNLPAFMHFRRFPARR